MAFFEKDFIIRYIDVDEQDELTNRGFIKYMQEIAGEHSSFVGYGLNELMPKNIAWIILNWKVKIYKRPKCNDVIRIKTWVSNFNKIFTFRDFEIYDNNNDIIGIASSKWVLKNHESKTILRFSDDLMKAYDAEAKSVFDNKWDKNIANPDSFEREYNYKIQRRDIDTNHHVNNLYYIDFANEALPDAVYNSKPTCIEIQYKKEIIYGDEILCRYSFLNDEHIVTIYSNDLETIYAVVRFK